MPYHHLQPSHHPPRIQQPMVTHASQSHIYPAQYHPKYHPEYYPEYQPHSRLQRVHSTPTLFHNKPFLNSSSNLPNLPKPTPSHRTNPFSYTMPSPLILGPTRKMLFPPQNKGVSEEEWPVDDTPNYSVGALPRPKGDTRFSRRSMDHARMRRIASHHSVAQARPPVRRSITAVEDEYQSRPYRLRPGGVALQGYCRMKLFAGIRCTRFLRLAKRQLECFDGGLRRRLWSVFLDGARVRIQMNGHKIILSKLHAGFVIEFYVPDEHSCKEWAAALLRASMLVRTHQPDIDTHPYRSQSQRK